MADPFIGEIRMFSGTFAPRDWAFCDGQLLAISDYDALFSLLGTMYGGDGQTTFGLPDLRGRLPLHIGSGYPQGQKAGTETVTLTQAELPAHDHAFVCSGGQGSSASPLGQVPAGSNTVSLYKVPSAPLAAMAPEAIGVSGGSQPHGNVQPFLCLNFIIALYGIYPSRS